MEYRNPKPTVDVVIFAGKQILLIRRKNPPLGWALPGGFVDEGETLEAAAIREVLEETGLEIRLDHLLGVYSDPLRDPRQHTVSVVYTARSDDLPEAGDDAAEARRFTLENLPEPIVFDHARIIEDAVCFVESGTRPDPMRDL
ncbi:MAG: NUDIX hydrolase [Myxococcota bacterium]|nr:NUDIX hydrolase [Myxococcota bacterium]